MKWRLLPGLTFAATLGLQATNPAPLLPVAAFFRSPTVAEIGLSPEGSHIVVITVENDQRQLSVINLLNGSRQCIVTGRVDSVEWVSDTRLIYQHGASWMATNLDGTETRMLSQIEEVRFTGAHVQAKATHLLSLNCATPDCVLVQRADYNARVSVQWLYPDVFQLNHRSGEFLRVEKNPGSVVRWLVDPAGEIRAATAITKDHYRVLYRPERTQPWRTVYESNVTCPDIMMPVAFAAGRKTLQVVARNGANTSGLFDFDPVTRQLGEKLWQHDHYNALGTLRLGPDDHIRGVLYESDRPQIAWFDEAGRNLQATVDGALPGAINLPVSCSRDFAMCVYLSSTDRQPGTFYLVDFVCV